MHVNAHRRKHVGVRQDATEYRRVLLSQQTADSHLCLCTHAGRSLKAHVVSMYTPSTTRLPRLPSPNLLVLHDVHDLRVAHRPELVAVAPVAPALQDNRPWAVQRRMRLRIRKGLARYALPSGYKVTRSPKDYLPVEASASQCTARQDQSPCECVVKAPYPRAPDVAVHLADRAPVAPVAQTPHHTLYISVQSRVHLRVTLIVAGRLLMPHPCTRPAGRDKHDCFKGTYQNEAQQS